MIVPGQTHIINLNNATSCKVEMDGLTIVGKKSVPAVDVYDYFYAKPDQESTRLYYSTIPAGQNAAVVIGNGNPGMSPYPYDDIELTFSSSLGYMAGASGFTSDTPRGLWGYNNWYIIQTYDSTATYCTESSPCLNIVSQNPCTTPELTTLAPLAHATRTYQ